MRAWLFFRQTARMLCGLQWMMRLRKPRLKLFRLRRFMAEWIIRGADMAAIISGEKVADVKSGLQYAKDYIENKSGNYSLNEEGTLGYYVDYVPRIGKYYQESLGLSEGTSIAYLVSAPVESMYGLDKALKAADVKIAELSEIPSRVNTGGAIVYGTESACRSAVEAFAEGVEYCAFHPMDIE